MQLENSKGTRDIPPEEKIIRNNLVDKMRVVFERYGYSPLETPLLEKYELMLAKGGAGEDSDVLKEVFKLSDQGKRKLALKFEQTLSFARYVGMNPNLRMPFKRYEVGPVFRDGPIKLGRYRQFWQCDVDVVGSSDMAVDAELISLAFDVFVSLGIDATIEVNNRKILKGLIEHAGIAEKHAEAVIVSIDKLAKVGNSGVRKELEEKKIPDSKISLLLESFGASGSNEDKILRLRQILTSGIGKEGIDELEQVLAFLDANQREKIQFNVSLARGLGYYTGTIFEGFANSSEIKSSICGGGRYDKLISSLIKNNREYPCVGISFGLDVLYDILREKSITTRKTVVQAYVIPIKTLDSCLPLIRELRSSGINADLDFSGKGISKNLDYVNAMNIPFAIIVGPKEIESGKVSVKDMASGNEEKVSLHDAIRIIKLHKN